MNRTGTSIKEIIFGRLNLNQVQSILGGNVTPAHNVRQLAVGLLTHSQLKEFSRVSTAASVFFILREWLLIAITAGFCHYFFSWPLYVLSILFIGARQHALAILDHEAVHNRLCRNRSLNDWLANLFASWPLFITVEGHRREHLCHHKNVGTENDLDVICFEHHSAYKFPKSKTEFYFEILLHFLGVRTLMTYYVLFWAMDLSSLRSYDKNGARVLYYLVIAAGLLAMGWGEFYLLYWLVPSLTGLVAVFYVRMVSEHSGIQDLNSIRTRNTIPTILEKLLIGPLNVGYHLDHHLFPSVPHYRLKKLHAELSKNSRYLDDAPEVHGYLGGLANALNSSPEITEKVVASP